ncbi:hypothetical protein FBEOM_13576 [Fusarium beomiforme]|uniref:Uncharacterized protein n=1 Tax=Fusarium beomiforme TaxID=44412 RepID=A0A9P5A662_9HYPO|nr:hypothetical protein FBEOM_13576 [Fusarium beomiforme]
MPPRRGGKSGPRPKPKRQSARLLATIGQLDTTPSRHDQSPEEAQPQDPIPTLPNQDGNPEPPNDEIPSTYDIDYDLNDDDLRQLVPDEPVPSAQPPDFSWSEIGSTRRSTPLREDEPNIFDQASLLDEFSSPKSGQGKLPTTQPLSESDLENKDTAYVDFSETASTVRRSSPYVSLAPSQLADEDALNFVENNPLALLPDTIPDSLSVAGLPPFPQFETMDHLPEDELYDVTPPKSTAELEAETSRKGEEVPQATPETSQRSKKRDPPQTSKTKAKPGKASKSHDTLTRLLEEELDPSGDDEGEKQASSPPERPATKRPKRKSGARQVQETPEKKPLAAATDESQTMEQREKGKKLRKQRAKTPLQFDEETLELKDAPPLKVVEHQPRMTLVGKLRESHAASVSPVTNEEKGTLGSKQRAAPKHKKPTQNTPKKEKPPKKPPPVTRKSGLKKVVSQDKPDTFEKEKKHVSPATKAAAKPSPSTNKRTTRAKVKEEKAPALQPPKVQEVSETKHETQGSTQDPIVLSSDPESSLLSEDDEFNPIEDFRPTEKRQPAIMTKPTVGELLVDPNAASIQSLDQAHREEVQPLVHPQALSQNPEPPRPSRRPKEQIAAQKRAVPVKHDPRKLFEEPLPSTQRNRVTGKGPREVLSARDTNILVQQNTSQARILKRPATTADPIVDVSQPPQKMSRLSRSFSVSQAGSPLPLETSPAQLVGGTGLGEMEDVKPTNVPKRLKQMEPRRSQRLRRTAE